MLLLHVLHDIIDDRDGEGLVHIRKSHLDAFLACGLHRADQCVVELLLFVGKLTHAALCQHCGIGLLTKALCLFHDLCLDVEAELVQAFLEGFLVAGLRRITDLLCSGKPCQSLCIFVFHTIPPLPVSPAI